MPKRLCAQASPMSKHGVREGNLRFSMGKNISMQNYVPASAGAHSSFVLAAPTCPICKLGMRFVKTTPIVFTPGLVDVSYVCDECGQRTKRTLKGFTSTTEARDL